MGAEWLRRFPGEYGLITGNFRRALADSYFETGHQQKADELYQSWLDDDPAWGWGWIGWADCYTPMVPARYRTTCGRMRSCAVATLSSAYGKPSTSRDGWRTSAAGPAVPTRPGSSGSRRKWTGGAPGGRRPGRRRPCRQASRVPRSSTRPGRPDGTSRAPAEAGRSSRSAAVPLRRHERTGATCALRWPVAQHSPAAAGRGCGVPWVSL